MKRIAALILPVLIAGCAAFNQEETTPTARELYDDAQKLLNEASYDEAIVKFQELEASYPNSAYAQQAVFDAAHAHYRQGEYERAIAETERFIQIYPDHPRLDYAFYLRGLAYFREDRGLLDYIGRQDPAERDRRSMLLAFDSFERLIKRFPNSQYAEDSARRMRYLINAMARHEIAVARYYLRREAFLAAASRAKRVLDIYPDSIANEDALVILARAYESLELNEPRLDAIRILRINFPDNELLKSETTETAEN